MHEENVMKSQVVGMNRTRKELRSLILHLAEKHDEVTRERGVMLLVGDLLLKEQEFMELSLETVFC